MSVEWQTSLAYGVVVSDEEYDRIRDQMEVNGDEWVDYLWQINALSVGEGFFGIRVDPPEEGGYIDISDGLFTIEGINEIHALADKYGIEGPPRVYLVSWVW